MSSISKNSNGPFLLLILDGFGYRKEKKHNAIAHAHMPNFNHLLENHPSTLIDCSGKNVGLPENQMGNSEVGHMNMGAGRVIYQDLTRIHFSIENGDFFRHPVLESLVHDLKAQEKNLSDLSQPKAIHILGLLSPGGIHSHEKHIHALTQYLAQSSIKNFYVHAFLDGRDCPPQSAASSLEALENHLKTLNAGQITSIMGRYYAMDRDQRWDRIEHAYDLLTSLKTPYHYENAIGALQAAYQRGETDEFVFPSLILKNGLLPPPISDDDIVIFMNFRADRARQLTSTFIQSPFEKFKRQTVPKLSKCITLTSYDPSFECDVLFPNFEQKNNISEYLSQLHYTQLHLAETEKYAHVTFFFNGGHEAPYPGEERILIPSPHVTTYDLQPEMSAFELTETLVKAILDKKYDFIVCNYANADMVGHTGNFEATCKALEVLDVCLGKIIEAIQFVHGECLLTSDHGNAEMMYDENTHQPHTAHTQELVPLIYIGGKSAQFISKGILADIAPTILYLMNIPIPAEMTGQILLQ